MTIVRLVASKSSQATCITPCCMCCSRAKHIGKAACDAGAGSAIECSSIRHSIADMDPRTLKSRALLRPHLFCQKV